MNRIDLVAAVAARTGLSKADCMRAVDGLFDAIADALKAGEEVKIVGFGAFTVGHRKASRGRNPRTGEPMMIPATKQPRFKAGKGLKEAVN